MRGFLFVWCGVMGSVCAPIDYESIDDNKQQHDDDDDDDKEDEEKDEEKNVYLYVEFPVCIDFESYPWNDANPKIYIR